jgi:subtilisin family serine protease
LDADVAAGKLPVVMQLPQMPPRSGESWPEYKERIASSLHAANKVLTGGSGTPLYLANSIAATLSPEQIEALSDTDTVRTVELDRLVQATLMDDAVVDAGLPELVQQNPHLTGAGIRVAVLDSGIDTLHPFLNVAASISTCGEEVEIPGSHGTHCAGSVASRDAVFPGIAPDVTLFNVKVLRANGSGTSTFITRGVDAALDLGADILTMSLGFNHLPVWSQNGHGWTCTDGQCELCTAVDNAVFFGATVLVAAGNEHDRAQALRDFGQGDTFDTELGCPGQSRRAITVGALTKVTFLPASFSSRGPTSYGETKPDLAGPGVNITSTVPVPRDLHGAPIAAPLRSHLFDRKSGTSMATPVVAGAAALIMQDRRAKGLPDTPADMRAALLNEAVTALPYSANTVGGGRVDLKPYAARSALVAGVQNGGHQQT